jgi:hypothetical protein
MLLAKASTGERIEPTPRARACCAQCGGEVLAKCGKLVSWHWAHRARDCDSWSEGESEWHLGWKRLVEPTDCEVVIGAHRADICTRAGVVIELQHSPIDSACIYEREDFYRTMVWLFDARAFDLALYPRGAELSFVWQRPRRALFGVQKPMYWDLGHGFLLYIDALEPHSPLGGAGGKATLLDAMCLASELFGASARDHVHNAARLRAPRVAECWSATRTLLREAPSIGLDGATREAMRKLGAHLASSADNGLSAPSTP